MISLPQVLLFCIAIEDGEGGLLLVSQAVEELFSEGLVPDLLDAYGFLLGRLATDEASWGESRPVGEIAALRAPEPAGRRLQAPDASPPQAELAEMAALWEDVLGRRPESADDDFFALGGDSLAATRLLARLAERRGGPVMPADLLARPTLSGMAEALRRTPVPPPVRRARRSWIRQTASSLAARFGLAPREREAGDGVGTRKRASHGMRLFTWIWFGQLISTLGSGLGSFALGVWLFQSTQSATRFTLLAFLASVTALVLSPFAGVMVDRWDRRRVMILSDCGAGSMTLLMASLFHSGRMEAWHTYPIVMTIAGLSAFQGPAFGASVRLLVPRNQLVRASGMAQTSSAISRIVGPLLAGGLVGAIGYQGVLLIDFATFLFAVSILIAVRIPTPPGRPEGAPAERGSLLRDSVQGWTYIRERPGLMSLLVLFAITNFSVGIIQVLLTPMILSFGSAADLGTVNSAGAAGALLGSLGLSVWGGPRNRIGGLFLFFLLQGVFLIVGGLRASVPLIAFAAFICMLTGPVINGCSQAIWQSKVATGIQGRVFAMRQMIAFSSLPLAYLVSGPLADHVFTPLLKPGGVLAGSVGRLIGVGEGRGVALLFIVLGVLLIASLLLSFANPRLRSVERDLPDAL